MKDFTLNVKFKKVIMMDDFRKIVENIYGKEHVKVRKSKTKFVVNDDDFSVSETSIKCYFDDGKTVSLCCINVQGERKNSTGFSASYSDDNVEFFKNIIEYIEKE